MHTTKTCKSAVRMMIDADIPALLKIDTGACPQMPLTEKHFRDCIRFYSAWTPLVIVSGGELRSFCLFQHDKRDLILFRLISNPASAWHASFAAYLNRMKGIGSWYRIIVDLPERELSTQVFFRRLGLVCTRVERGAYDDDPDDVQSAYVFEYRRQPMEG